MVRRYVFAAAAALCLSLLGMVGGCGGSGTLIYPSVAIFSVSGTTIAPSTSDVVAAGTVEIDNTNTVTPVTVTFSSLFPDLVVTVPPNGRLSIPLPTVTGNTSVTLQVTGGNSAILNIHV
jgi:hypothetical protein